MEETYSRPSYTYDEIIELLKSIQDKTLEEIDKKELLKAPNANRNKGIAGAIIEQSVLGMNADTRQEPDILVDNKLTEVKTTGLKWKGTKNTPYIGAKEPVSVTAVSPDTIIKEEFKNSAFWHKLESLLFVYYLYEFDAKDDYRKYGQFHIKGYQLSEFHKEDIETLKSDWTLVRDFIRQLYEEYDVPSDHFRRVTRELKKDFAMINIAPSAPKPMRFRLKASAMDTIIRRKYDNNLVKLPEDYTSFKELDDKLHDLAIKYKGWTVEQLAKEFSIDIRRINKSMTQQIVCKMLGAPARDLSEIELFNKFGIIGKTIISTVQNTYTEQMKLFTIDFAEATDKNIEFEDSDEYRYFNENQFLCMVFKETEGEKRIGKKCPLKDCVFSGFKRLSFDDDFINNNVKPVWDRIRDLIWNNKLIDEVVCDKAGNPKITKSGVVSSAPNFPKQKEGIVFIRGTGKDATAKTLTINDIAMYPQQYWIRGKYIFDLMNEKDWI